MLINAEGLTHKHNPDKMNLNLNGMVSMWKMRELVDKATNIVMNYTETEAKVAIKYSKKIKNSRLSKNTKNTWDKS